MKVLYAFPKRGRVLFILKYVKNDSALHIGFTRGAGNTVTSSSGHNQGHPSPLVLDLDGDGTIFAFIYTTDTHVDVDEDGYAGFA